MQLEEQVVLIGEDGVFETLQTMAQANKINEGHIRAIVGTINKLHTYKTTTSAVWIIEPESFKIKK